MMIIWMRNGSQLIVNVTLFSCRIGDEGDGFQKSQKRLTKEWR